MNTFNNRPIRAAALWSLLVMLLASTACGAGPDTSSLPGTGHPPGAAGEQIAPPTPSFGTTEVESDQVSPRETDRDLQESCPNVDAALWPLIQADDHREWGEDADVKVKGDKVQVLLILAGQDTQFLRDMDIEVGTQIGPKVQAFVPIDALCDLANEEDVLAIRLPARAANQ